MAKGKRVQWEEGSPIWCEHLEALFTDYMALVEAIKQNAEYHGDQPYKWEQYDLYVCERKPWRQIDHDFFDLDGDSDLPKEIDDAVAAFNEAVAKVPGWWMPTHRVDVTLYPFNPKDLGEIDACG